MHVAYNLIDKKNFTRKEPWRDFAARDKLCRELEKEFGLTPDKGRGQGMGRNILMQVIEKLAKPVILEVEPMHDTNSQRRIRFYERLGFHLCDTPYRMPKLDETHGDLELKLMSYPDPLTPEQFQQRVQHIYRYVYEKTI